MADEEKGWFESLTGYKSPVDMVDGGGPGQSGATFDNDNDPNNAVTGIASFSNTVTGNSHANDGYGDKNSSGQDPKYNSTSNVTGSAPSGIQNIAGYVTPVGIIGKLSGWVNGLDPTKDKNSVVDGRQVYTSSDGMQYSYNFLGLPYEVEVVGDKVQDALNKDVNGKYPGDEGYDATTSRYAQMAAEARANGDEDTAAAIEEEAAANAGEGAGGAGSAISQENILKMLETSGVAKSNEEIAALVSDPKAYLDAKGINLSDVIPNLDPETAGALLDPSNPNYLLKSLETYNPATVSGISGVNTPTQTTPLTYDTATNVDRMDNPQYQVDPVTGKIRDQNLVDAEGYTLDMKGSATGVNADGTTNYTGQALNEYASQGMSQVIDTRTVSGKLLAQNLGEGNYVDMKSTVTGQLEILSEAFVDGNGNPKIPAWAQAQARAVGRTIAFKGMTGAAATAAMATALMEASLPIAQQDAEFFKTLTIKNLDNKQQSIINKATVLSKFDLANLDAREAAAVQNAQAFLEMDLTNLSNEQQAEVINAQSMVQALFEDTQQENVQRRFTVETQNDFTKFYDELGVQVDQFNASLFSEIAQFNAGERNDATEFRMTMENARQQFYANMQYAVDAANAKWRQEVALENTQMSYDAAATDIKNYLDLSQEGLNRMWDRTDATLDYLFKGALSEEEFELRLLLGEMNAQAQSSGGPSLFDTIVGAATTLGAAYITRGSDARMKENIQPYDVHKGIQFYTWDWNDEAKAIGWDQYPTFGVIAQEVQKTHPDAVVEGPHGYLMVNYGKLINEI